MCGNNSSMPIPPPPPPEGPPPAPTFSQVNTHTPLLPVCIIGNLQIYVKPSGQQVNYSPRQLNQEVSKGRGALLSDICRGTRLKKVAAVNDRSAPLLDSKSPTPKSPTPVTDHPYIRLYQYLHQNQPKQQGVPSKDQKLPLSLERKKTAPEASGVVGGSQVLASHHPSCLTINHQGRMVVGVHPNPNNCLRFTFVTFLID